MAALEAGHAACRSAFRTLSSGGDVSADVLSLLHAETTLQIAMLDRTEPTAGPRADRRAAEACTTALQDAEAGLLAALALAEAEIERDPVEWPAADVASLAAQLSVAGAAPAGQHAFNAAADTGLKMGWGLPAPPQHFRSA
jgi:hypothetical protein